MTELAAGEPVDSERPRLGDRAQGQWAAVTVAAHRVATLTDQAAAATDQAASSRLLHQRDREHDGLLALLRAWGLLEGQDGFVWRRYAVERASRRAVPADPRVAELVYPMTRLDQDPAAVIASLTSMVPLVARDAGVRGAQVVEGEPKVRVILDDLRVHDLAVAVDLPSDSSRFVVLAGDSTAGWQLRVRPDASRAAVGMDVAGALAELVQQVSGQADPVAMAAESTAARLRFLRAWHRVAGPLAQPVIRGRAQELVGELIGVGTTRWSRRAGEVTAGGLQFAERVAGERRWASPAEHHIAAREAASDVPPQRTFLTGQAISSLFLSLNNAGIGLAAEPR